MTANDTAFIGLIVIAVLMVILSGVNACSPDADLINRQTKERLEKP